MKNIMPTMIKLSLNQKMDTKKSVNDFRKNEFDPFKVYAIDKDGNMDCMSGDSFINEIKNWSNLTHHEKIACVNFVKSMNIDYDKFNEYNKYMKRYAKFTV